MRLSGSAAEYELLQWANDWIYVDLGEKNKDGDTKLSIVSPALVVLTAAEVARLQDDYQGYLAKQEKKESHHTGFFWAKWRLVDAGPVGFLEPRPIELTMLPELAE